MIIDGVEYERVDNSNSEVCIVVCDRGFVLVGRVSKDGKYIRIRNCHCVRKWGTNAGLGQLALEGPQPDTKLDPQPETRVHELQVVQIINCVESSWTL